MKHDGSEFIVVPLGKGNVVVSMYTDIGSPPPVHKPIAVDPV